MTCGWSQMKPGLTSWDSRNSPTSLSSRRAAERGLAHSTPLATHSSSRNWRDASDSNSRGMVTPSTSSRPGSMGMRRQGGEKSMVTGASSGPLAWYSITYPPVTSLTMPATICSVMSMRSL